MLKIVFPKSFPRQNAHDNQREDDIEAGSVKDHTENYDEQDGEIKDVEKKFI